MKITWLGTNSVRIEAAGERFLVDPFIQLRGGENPNTQEAFEEDRVILVTHGHFDHLVTVPRLLEEGGADPTVFCGKTAAKTLEEFCEDTDSVAVIRPGMRLVFGQAAVTVLRGKHIVFDRRLIRETLGRILRPRRFFSCAGNLPFLIWANRRFPEGETLFFELEAEGKRVQIMGSLNLDPDEEYVPGADLLIMPYQGSSFPEKEADRVIRRLLPRRILLSHFDDAFPPLSSHMELGGLKTLMKEKYPQIAVARPTAGKALEI